MDFSWIISYVFLAFVDVTEKMDLMLSSLTEGVYEART